MQELVFNLNTRNDCVAIHYFGLKIRSLSGLSKKIAAFNKRVLAMSAGFFSDFKVYPPAMPLPALFFNPTALI
jgi:hypothetical protein